METKTVIVTGEQAVVRKGAVCLIQDTGHGHWLVLKVNGKRTTPATLFLVEGRDFPKGGAK